MSVPIACQVSVAAASDAGMEPEHAIALASALVAAAVALPATAEPLDASHALVLRTFAVDAARAPNIPRCARSAVILGLAIAPLASDRFDWLSPLFVWIEPGYAFTELTVAVN